MSSMAKINPTNKRSIKKYSLLKLVSAISCVIIFLNLRGLQLNQFILSSPMSSSIQSTPSVPIATVAYVISLTSCTPNFARHLYDIVSILRRSIQLNSFPRHPHSRYASKLYAFTIGNDEPCQTFLRLAGAKVVVQDPPIDISFIQTPDGSNLKSGISKDGCCGDKELIKLSTYKLEDYPIAIHLDLDTLVMQPMDELFNVMYFGPSTFEGKKAREKIVEVVAPTYLNKLQYGVEGMEQRKFPNVNTTAATSLLQNITVNAFYTKDYNMINPHKHSHRVGVQGGFLVVRPNHTTYTNILSMVYSGEFYPGRWEGSGWYKSGYGNHIYGGMTIQGLLAYYFSVVELETSVELNRCKYNQIADNARVSTRSKNPKFPRGTLLPSARNESNPQLNYTDADCRDGRLKPNCEDVNCQKVPVNETRVAHYTYCKEPWTCVDCDYMDTYKEYTCYHLMREWFRVRSTLHGERRTSATDAAQGGSNVGAVGNVANINAIGGKGSATKDIGNCFQKYFLGYCDGVGRYVPMVHRNISAFPDEYIVTS